MSVTVLSDNHSAGFGRVVPREEQVILLLIAVQLVAIQVIANLISRKRSRKR